MATKRTKSIADSLLPKPEPMLEPKRELDLVALERQVQAIHLQAEAKKMVDSPALSVSPVAETATEKSASKPKKKKKAAPSRRRNLDGAPAERLYRLSIDLPESVYFQMRDKISKQRMKVTHRALVMGLIEEYLSMNE